MKFFEGIEIALEGYLLAQFQFPRISYSLKASAEERGEMLFRSASESCFRVG
jgi:hypothetical protein